MLVVELVLEADFALFLAFFEGVEGGVGVFVFGVVPFDAGEVLSMCWGWYMDPRVKNGFLKYI